MFHRPLLAAAAASLALLWSGAATAAIGLVGSWRVTDGPSAFTQTSAQQVAAQLFGGSASDFLISTSGQEIDHQAWYVIDGAPGSALIDAENATDFFGLAISAYRHDPLLAAEADRFTNYAYRQNAASAAPEPHAWALMIAGFGVAGAGLRRRRNEAY